MLGTDIASAQFARRRTEAPRRALLNAADRRCGGQASWTRDISYGEMSRTGYVEYIGLYHNKLRFIFQVENDVLEAAWACGKLPWQPGFHTQADVCLGALP